MGALVRPAGHSIGHAAEVAALVHPPGHEGMVMVSRISNRCSADALLHGQRATRSSNLDRGMRTNLPLAHVLIFASVLGCVVDLAAQLPEDAGEDPGDLHLGDADLCGDLGLGALFEEPHS